METYNRSTQYWLWYIMTKGALEVKTPIEDWTQVEFNHMQLNDKVKYVLTYALSKVGIKDL